MIHKFDGIPANVNTREGVIVLVDEAHKTAGSDLGNYLLAALPNATYIGLPTSWVSSQNRRGSRKPCRPELCFLAGKGT